MSTDIKPICLCNSPRGMICTLDKGHSGCHIAEGEHTQVLCAWPNDSQAFNFDTSPSDTPAKAIDASPALSQAANLN